MLRRFLIGLTLACAADAVGAERATERYAPLQIEMARQALDRARAAAALNESALAASFAAQAGLDARIAWAMTESAALRRAAAEVASESARLLRLLGPQHPSADRKAPLSL